MQTKLLFIQALSSLQPGTGQGVGVIDQPVSREKATGLPYLPGSTIKGVLRDCWELENNPDLEKVFGQTTEASEPYAGSVSLMDGRLLLLPVRSLAGVFAWVTSPFILNRLVRDCKMGKIPGTLPAAVTGLANDRVLLTQTPVSSVLKIAPNNNRVVLEDLSIDIAPTNPLTDIWAAWLAAAIQPNDPEWQSDFKKRFCIVSDDVLSYFSETGTEVTPRIRIDDDTKTASGQALWYEESLPAETILISLVVAQKVMATPTVVFDGLEKIVETPVQFGGGATVGKGLCKLSLYPGNVVQP
ncbi:MAG TPA: type III-B CRISPR module RAMP protein Cmr4 [Anaerolineaceae bacterium]|jgi:CRISPR-associated protein Cmr4|nr:type III-B CRISPR module RAMP protein Cmr4 [Anaerolineaceae bacterium]